MHLHQRVRHAARICITTKDTYTLLFVIGAPAHSRSREENDIERSLRLQGRSAQRCTHKAANGRLVRRPPICQTHSTPRDIKNGVATSRGKLGYVLDLSVCLRGHSVSAMNKESTERHYVTNCVEYFSSTLLFRAPMSFARIFKGPE